MNKTVIIYGINGPVIYLKGDSGFKISEMVYVGKDHLVGAIHHAEELPDVIREVLEMDGAAVCEVYVTKYQKTEPKTSAKKLEDGSMVSAPLEDMYPFLDQKELEENMYIPLPKKY